MLFIFSSWYLMHYLMCMHAYIFNLLGSVYVVHGFVYRILSLFYSLSFSLTILVSPFPFPHPPHPSQQSMELIASIDYP